jgi:hypothetical protein
MSDESQTIVLSIIEAVAAADRVDVGELPPLSAAIDPDAPNALVDPSGDRPAPTRISFPYAGHDVTITVDGDVILDSDAPWAPTFGSATASQAARTDEPLAE